MTASISFTVPGNPRPKGRPRFVKGRPTYTPKATREHEAAVAWAARSAFRGKPLEGPLRVDLAFHFADNRRRDLDNAIKAATDPLIGIVYRDDSQIVELVASKHLDRENPRTEVEVRKIAEAAA